MTKIECVKILPLDDEMYEIDDIVERTRTYLLETPLSHSEPDAQNTWRVRFTVTLKGNATSLDVNNVLRDQISEIEIHDILLLSLKRVYKIR